MMKKLFILLFVSSILVACSSSDSSDDGGENGKGTTTQLGKTTTPIPASDWKGDADITTLVLPLRGQWVLTHENGKATSQFLAYLFGGGLWYNLKTKPKEGEAPYFVDWIEYVYNETQIKEKKQV